MPELRVGDIELHPERHMLVKGNAEVQLRAKEVSLLKYMMQHPDEIFSAQQLLERTWPSDGEGSTNSVRTWINLLRNKLTQIGDANLIRTVPGAGYMIDRDYVTR